MAQLKDLLVAGPSRFVGDMFGNVLQITTIKAPTTAGGTTYGPGTSGKSLLSNGTSVYWGNPSVDISSISGIVPMSQGGTGVSGGFTDYGVVYKFTDSNVNKLASTAAGAANTALMGKGSSAAPAFVSVSPSISVTAGTGSDAPKINLTVLGVSGTAQALTTASTSVYGVTKLTSSYSNTNSTLAMTGTGVKAALDTLVFNQVGGTGKYISLVSQSGGVVYATATDFSVSNSWTASATPTTAGPVLTTTLNGVSDSAAIPVASSSASGVVTTGEQTFNGTKIYQSKVTFEKEINQALTGGTNTAAVYTSPNYYPTKWTFNKSIIPTTGDIVTILTPGAGHDYGVYLSLDNGNTYHPISVSGNTRLTTHYPTSSYITLIYDGAARTDSMFPLAGGNARVNVTGSWRVLNYYDSGNSGLYYNYNPKAYKVGSTAIVAYDLVAEDDNGLLVPARSVAHKVGSPIFVCNAALNANATGSWQSLYDRHYNQLLRNNGSNITTTAYKQVYLKGTITNRTFTPDTTTPFIIGTENCNVSGAYYMYIGDATTSNSYIAFNNNHPYYYYNGTILLPYGGSTGGYGQITIGSNGGSNSITPNTNSITATTGSENFILTPGNQWIQMAADNTATTDTITVAHSTVFASDVTTWYGSGASSTAPGAQTPGYGSTFYVPHFKVDKAGHIIAIGEHTVKIPASDNTNYYHTSGSWNGLTYTATKVGSPGDLAFTIPTGTTDTTVAVGSHNHTVAIKSSDGTTDISTLAYGTTYNLKVGTTSKSFTMPALPSYSDIGAAEAGHVHPLSITTAAATATSDIALQSETIYKLTAGNNTFNFTTPTDTNYYHKTGDWSGLTYTASARGGAPALAFTIPTGTTSTTVAVGNHTHGNISNTGTLSTASRAVVTDANKNITVLDLSVSSPSASGSTTLSFIDTISQNSQGKISATKKTVQDAGLTQTGVVNTTTQTFGGDKTFGGTDSFTVKASQIRFQNKAANTSQALSGSSNATTYPYVTSIMIGDGREVTLDEYGDGNLAIHSNKGIFLHTASAPIAEYNASSTYSVGAIVWYNRGYYRCKTAISTAEAWTSGHWESITTSAGTLKTDATSFVPVVTNTSTLGTSSLFWKAAYIGTAASYGNSTTPIYWKAGVPTACSYSISASVGQGIKGGVAYFSTTTTIDSTAAGTAGQALISAGTSAPIWYGGFSLTGTQASNWKAAFSGTTDASSTTTAGVTMAGGLGVAKQLRVGTNATIGGTLDVTGATTLSSTLGVTGVATFNNTTDSSSSSTGSVIIKGGLGIAKAVNIGTGLTVGGNTAVGGTLGVTGATTLSSTLTVNGATQINNTLTVGTTSVNRATTLNGTLGVTGNTTIGGTLTVGTSSVNKATTLYGTLTATGNTSIGGTFTVGTTTSNQATTLNGTLGVTGIVSFTNTTAASTDSNGSVRLSGGMSIKGNIIPTHNTYTLGDADNKWKEIHVMAFAPDFTYTNASAVTVKAASWKDLFGGNQTGLEEGTYIIQLKVGSAYYSGVCSWINTNAAANVTALYEEIPLHGVATSLANQFYLRTAIDSSGIFLQISQSSATDTSVTANTMTIKMKKII